MKTTLRSILTNRILSIFRTSRPRRVAKRHSVSFLQLEDRSVPAIYTVNALTDDGTADPGDPLKGDLRYCLTQANASVGVADTINFDNAITAGQTIFLSSEILISDAVTVNGPTLLGPASPNVILDGAGTHRIFNITTAAGIDTLAFSNLKLANASSSGSGGAVILTSVEDTYSFTDCVFDGNKGANYGGAVGTAEPANTAYGILNLNRVKFTNNSNITNFGGALALAEEISGTGITQGWTANIVDTTFDSNVCTRNGGAFFTRGYAVNISMTNTTFSNNTVSTDGFGGAISNLSGAGTQSGKFVFTNCTFANNVNADAAPGPPAANGGGGGVMGNGGSATPSITFRNSTFSGNSASYTGGVFAASSGAPTVYFESCILYGNSVATGSTEFLSGNVSAKNSIIFDKTGANSFTDLGGNQYGAAANPLLGTLGTTLGGLTAYFVPGPGSPARENGYANPAVTTDQRGAGFPRLLGSKVDVGSIESQDPTPIASASVTNVLTPSVSDYQFTVTYSDDVAVNFASIKTGNVTLSGPNSFTATPTLVSVSPSGDGTPLTATYKFTPPVNGAAGWDFSDNGTYTVTMVANQVRDNTAPTPNYVNAGPLTSFTVGIPQTFTVNALTDTGTGSGTKGDLRYCITQANASAGAIDNIVFDATVFSTAKTILLTAGELPITEGINITNSLGSGKVTVDAQGSGRIFNVSGPGSFTVTIAGLNMANGNAVGDGGAIFLSDESLVLNNNTFTACTASGDGGALILGTPGGSINATNCTFISNIAGAGGGVAATNANAQLVFTNCSMQLNSAASGGAIDLNLGNLVLNNSLLANNSASGPGGAIRLTGIDGTLLFSNSSIVANTAGTTGGAISTDHGGGLLQIRNCTISANSATTGGGGIFHNGSSVQPGNMAIVSTIISGNTSTSADMDVAAVTTTYDYTIIGSTAGAGVFAGGVSNPPIGTIANLAPLANNGGLTQTMGNLPGSPAINAGSNPDNLATDQRGVGFPREVPTGSPDIGAFEGVLPIPSGSLTPIAPIVTPGSTPNTVVVTFTDETGINVSTIKTSNIQILDPSSNPLTITGVTVNNGTNGTPRVATYTFTVPVNSASGWDNSDNGTYTIKLIPGQVSDTDTPTTHTNVAQTLGTFVVTVPVTYTVDQVSDVNDGNTTPGNLSIREAIDLANNDGQPSLILFSPTVFAAPQSVVMAGGVMTISAAVTITGPAAGFTLDANKLNAIFNVDVLAVTNNAINISNMTLTNGSTSGSGGAILNNDENLSLTNVTISNCVADTGGGAIWLGAGNTVGGSLSLTNSTISGNSSAGPGGAINVNSQATVSLLNTSITGNTAGGAGGGFYWLANGGATITNSTISGNSCGGVGGGGFYFWGTANTNGINFINSTVSGNFTTGGGGGAGICLNAFAGSAKILNSTITQNNTSSAGGGGLSHTSAAINISSSIIAGNSAGGVATGATADLISITATTVTGANNLIGINDATTKFSFTGATNPLIGSTASKINPLLGPLALNGASAGRPLTHALLTGSPAINAGNNDAGLATDERGAGFPRTSGGATDIGAFEVQVVAPVVTGFVVNDGAAQRSRLTKVVVNFASPVDAAQFQAVGAVTFTRTGVATNNIEPIGTVVNTSNGLIVSPATGSVSSITLTFQNIDNAGIDFGSLSDGRWQLAVTPASYTSPNTPADTQLRRLFGNVDNDTTVGGTDFGFYPPFGAIVGSPFDFNNDGSVQADDFGQFGNRYGFTLV